MDTSKYTKTWQERFEFFEKNGAPSSKEHQAAFKKLSFSKRTKINMNFFAFFFGLLYFIALGMWKKGLAILGVGIVIFIIFFIVSIIVPISPETANLISTGLSFAIAGIYAVTANYSYYLKEAKGDDSWNPFKGIRMI
ncbi:DUF2628 domain-containing protein [Xenorhabdus innexi]|uniref:DUF2628 domain-containing protein n=1 Tax=Xenorhabdus innexi TaxID=290109 RepID=A0A1N6N152_9GAMM|nr:DUF2628 domain-containing protein [Xenorhabdus innexi]PHM31153.1 hypothetical protein Xinn_02994 [Xenorhabdus innexi]SIP74800.1 conserved membrane hypothetical protein [Xenorhabdus innexi]